MKKIMIRFYLAIKKIKKKLQYSVEFIKLKFVKSEFLEVNKDEAMDNLEKYRKWNPIQRKCENKKKTTILSIIIPVYNAERYVCECIDSIINHGINVEYEIICINDGSTDNTLNVLKKYENIENFKLISQKNSGASVARNKGIDESTGKFIMFVDSDDYLPNNNSINDMLSEFEDENVDIVFGTYGKFVKDIEIYPKCKNKKSFKSLLEVCNQIHGAPWGKIYKADLWNNIRFYEDYMFEDVIIFLNIFTKANIIRQIEKPVYCFRSDNNSLFKRSKKDYKTIDCVWGVYNALEYAKSNEIKFNEEYSQLVIWHLSKLVYTRLESLDSDEIMKNSFVIASCIMKEYFKDNSYVFTGKYKKIYRLIEQSFNKKDFELWKQCCKVLKYSECI